LEFDFLKSNTNRFSLRGNEYVENLILEESYLSLIFFNF